MAFVESIFGSSFICINDISKNHSRDRSRSQMRVPVDHSIQDSYELGIGRGWLEFRGHWRELSRVDRAGGAP